MSSEQSDFQKQVLNLLSAAAPERSDEIKSLWTKYGLAVEIVPDSRGVAMKADKTRIMLSQKTIDIYWVLGFSAWKSIEVYSPAIVTAVKWKHTIEEMLNRDNSLGLFERHYKSHMAAVQTLVESSTTAEATWPSDIPSPQSDREKISIQDKAAYDLTLLAVACLLLHEFKHVIFLNEGNQPDNLREEEIECDRWAREFLTAKLVTYAEKYKQDIAEVSAKRAIAIALAAIIIHAITPAHGHWGNSEYPPLGQRLDALIGDYSLPSDSNFWLWTAGLLTGVLRQQHRPIQIKGSSFKDLVVALLKEFR